MIPRRWFLVLAASLLRAQEDPEDATSIKLLTHVTEALSEGNALEALRSFDKSMRDYGTVEASLTSLTGQFFVSSSIEFVSRDGDNYVVDWFLELRAKAEDGPLLRRRKQVTVKISKASGKPKIIGLMPLDLFAPIVP